MKYGIKRIETRGKIIENNVPPRKRECMQINEFKNFRALLNKTQKQMSQLLGVSLNAIHSYEQGWRSIPPHIERQMLFLVIHKKKAGKKGAVCWEIRDCPEQWKKKCPAWEFSLGDLCWFINGTICDGEVKQTWGEKIAICKSCPVFLPFI